VKKFNRFFKGTKATRGGGKGFQGKKSSYCPLQESNAKGWGQEKERGRNIYPKEKNSCSPGERKLTSPYCRPVKEKTFPERAMKRRESSGMREGTLPRGKT